MQIATGYNDFELMFERRNTRCAELVEEMRTPQAIFAEKREQADFRKMADVVSRQAEAREKRKERFDAARRPIEFDVGSFVLVRQIGRRSTLQNRFVGPHVITSKNADNHDLENVDGKPEKLQRYVNSIKPHHQQEVARDDINQTRIKSDWTEIDQFPPNRSSERCFSNAIAALTRSTLYNIYDLDHQDQQYRHDRPARSVDHSCFQANLRILVVASSRLLLP